jgi:RHS repeat-associated protein
MRVGNSNTFKYDPLGRRIYKSSSSSTSVFAYDGDNLIEETNPSGTVVARYTETEDVDEPLAMLRSSATNYYQADALGSVTSLSNSAGGLAQTYSFDSFGKTTPTGSLINPFQYTAREFDTETNLYFYRARYYDPFSGRFVSEDPGRFPGGINFYTYVENDPVGLFDPFGFCPWQVHTRPLKGLPVLPHYYFFNTQTGQSIGLGPAGGVNRKTVEGSPVPGDWERNEKPGHKEGDVPEWACSCVDRKAKNPGNPPNYCTYQGNRDTNPHPICTNCAGWVISVLQDCYNQGHAGQQ